MLDCGAFIAVMKGESAGSIGEGETNGRAEVTVPVVVSGNLP
jgi:hypothetical protein